MVGMDDPRRRADSGSRERLLRAGLAIARRNGFKAMTVRAVAARAQANLGSFVYHFGKREAFVEELIERWYAPMFEQIRLTADGADDALAALRRAILQLVGWIVDNRSFLARLVLDAGAGEAGARRFLRSLDQRHPALLLGLIVRAQRAGQLREDDPRHQLLFLMTTLAAPVLLFHLLGQNVAGSSGLARALAAFTTDPDHVETRLGWALRGLAR